MRCIKYAAAILGICFSFNAYSLGLGDVEVRSSLGKPLQAVVPLVGINRLELDALKVNPNKHKTKLSDNGFVYSEKNKLKYRLEDISPQNNQANIYLYTDHPVKEPIFHFLLELEWENGNLTREFFAFIEPVVSARATGDATAVATVTQKQSDTNLSENTNSAGTVVAKPSTSQATAIPAEKNAEQDTHAEISVEQLFGPTVSGNSLWRVALARS